MDGIDVIMGSLSPMLVNYPDLKKPRDLGGRRGPQGAAVFVSKIVVFFLGLASTARYRGSVELRAYLLGHLGPPDRHPRPRVDTVLAGVVYVILFRVGGLRRVYLEGSGVDGRGWEYLAKEGRDGLLDREVKVVEG
ncbi:hypothetical protein BDW75DRAFT_174181 [Aspergillus navahoensis]